MNFKGLTPFLLFVAAGSAVEAQTIKPLDVAKDPNGVDWISGQITAELPVLEIPAAPSLTFQSLRDFMPYLEGSYNSSGYSGGDGSHSASVNAGKYGTSSFSCSPDCRDTKGGGALLAGHPTSPVYIYAQGGTGVKVRFDLRNNLQGYPTGTDKFNLLATRIVLPEGETLTFSYQGHVTGTYNGRQYKVHRPVSVRSSIGYTLSFQYQSDVYGGDWTELKRARITRDAAPSVVLAELQYSETTVTDLAGRVWSCSNCRSWTGGPQPGSFLSMQLPGRTVPSVVAEGQYMDHPGPAPAHSKYVTSVTRDGVRYDYSWEEYSNVFEPTPHVKSVRITGPDNFVWEVSLLNKINASPCSSNVWCGSWFDRTLIKSFTDSAGRRTEYEHDEGDRLRRIRLPEGNSVEVDYDSAGNITARRQVPKPGSSLPILSQTSFFDLSGHSLGDCGSFQCWRPKWIQDSRGNRTDYTWSDAHGQLLTQLDPPNEQSRRKKLKMDYDDRSRLVREEICETDVNGTELTCGTAASYVRTFTYFRATSLIASETRTNGTGDTSLTTTFEYDDAGRQIAHTPPAGT